jgi:hypothetical protein
MHLQHCSFAGKMERSTYRPVVTLQSRALAHAFLPFGAPWPVRGTQQQGLLRFTLRAEMTQLMGQGWAAPEKHHCQTAQALAGGLTNNGEAAKFVNDPSKGDIGEAGTCFEDSPTSQTSGFDDPLSGISFKAV